LDVGPFDSGGGGSGGTTSKTFDGVVDVCEFNSGCFAVKRGPVLLGIARGCGVDNIIESFKEGEDSMNVRLLSVSDIVADSG